MVAPGGTVGRDLIDWFASKDRTSRYFELGGQEFIGRSVTPTVESQVRADRLIAMLKSNGDVTVKVIGYTNPSPDAAADQKLSEDRAQWLVRALADGGIAAERLSAEGQGAANPIGDTATDKGRAMNERVALLLSTTR